MAIFLYTDFGSADVYVGQVKAVLQEHAPDIAVIDLLHDAPAFNVKAGATCSPPWHTACRRVRSSWQWWTLTGFRTAHADAARRLQLGARRLAYARVFSEVKKGAAFWYVNSLGLAEIAANGASAATKLKLRIGQRVRLV